MLQEEEIENLMDFGLTNLQAKVYSALSRQERSSAKDLANTSQVARQEVYRILAELISLGLVERIITTPTQFRAAPLQEVVSLLLERRTKKTAELQAKARILIKKALSSNKSRKATESGYEFVEIPEKRFSERTTHIEVTKQLDLIVGLHKFTPWMYSYEEELQELLNKGVIMRFITDKPQSGSHICKKISNLTKSPMFSIRYIANATSPTSPTSQYAQVAILDNTRASLSIAPSTASVPPLLQSNHPSFINLAQQYFETMWLHAEKAEANNESGNTNANPAKAKTKNKSKKNKNLVLASSDF